MKSKYYLGIDGGGTKTEFALADSAGNIIKTVNKAGSNPNDRGMDAALAVLREGIDEICSGLDFGDISVFAGISGGGFEANKKKIAGFLESFGFCGFGNGNDLANVSACLGDKKKIILIMGTGFSVIADDGESKSVIGGWGQLFDAGGCGYTIGRDALYAAMREYDGTGPKTALSGLIEAKTGENIKAHLLKFYGGGKKYIASFAPLCFEACRAGDSEAFRIISENAAFAAENLLTAHKKLGGGHIRVLVSGGLVKDSDILFPLIEAKLAGTGLELVKLEGHPVKGAVIRAMSLAE